MASLLLSLILMVVGPQQRGAGARGTPTPPPAPEPVGTERIAGTVMQGQTQRPFPRVRVELRREDYGERLSGYEKSCNPARDIGDPKLRRYAMTDANGHFSFQNIVPGRYYVLAEHEGYLRAEYGRNEGIFPRGIVLEIGPQEDTPNPPNTQPFSRGRAVTTGVRPTRPGLPGSILENLVLRLFPAPTISGRVFDEEGAAVPAAIVQVFQYRFASLNGRTLKPVRSIFTDDNGEYRAFWLNPGRYVLSAAYSDYVLQPWRESIRFTRNLPDPDNRYPVVFYPDVDKPSEAFPVAVGTVAAPPIDIKLWKRPRFNVEIRFVGAPAPPNASVILVPYGGDLCAAMDFAIAPRKDGIVEIRDVPAGQYLVMAISGRESLSELRPLPVDQHIKDYLLQILPPVDIAVSAPETVRVNLTRTGNEVSQRTTAERDPEGKLRFNAFFKGVGPGSYYITADAPPGYYVSSIAGIGPKEYCEGQDVRPESSRTYQYLDTHGHLSREKPFIFPGDAWCFSVSILQGGRLYGRVFNKAGMPVAGALVVGLPRSVWGTDDNKVAFTPPDRYLTATTDSGGGFVLIGAVPSTEYKLFAFEDLDTNLIYDPQLLDRFSNRDLIDIEEVAGPDSSVQLRTQLQGGSIRSVIYGSGTLCSPNILCILKAISAEETRELNMGRD